MALPQTDVVRIRRWCDAQVPKHLWGQVKVEADVELRHVTVVEVRPPWDGVGGPTSSPVAQLRWTASRGEWSLYWRDRNLRFHRYNGAEPTPHVQILLDVLGSREDAVFWG